MIYHVLKIPTQFSFGNDEPELKASVTRSSRQGAATSLNIARCTEKQLPKRHVHAYGRLRFDLHRT